MNDIKSPCTRKCYLDHGYCEGCGRSVQEIAGWPNLTAKEKTAILNRLRATNVLPAKSDPPEATDI